MRWLRSSNHLGVWRTIVDAGLEPREPCLLDVGERGALVCRALPRVPDNPYVLVGAREGGYIVNLQKPWRRIRKPADIDDVRIHDLRHSFASIAAAHGASLQRIGRLLGHTNAQTTQRYAHLVADQVKELNETVGRKVGAAFDGREC